MKTVFLFFFVAAAALVPLAPAQTPGPMLSQDAINVIKELTKMENTPDRLTGGLWLPAEYFELSLKNNPNITPESLGKIVESFGKYTVLGILDAQKNADGTKTYASASDIFESTKLISQDGSALAPLSETEVDISISRLLDLMKPKLRQMAGAIGENMSFVVFPGKDTDDKKIANPLVEGKLEVVVNGHSLIWRLPLGSMVPAKTCPACHEQFKGNYHFCPYDGMPLD